LEHCTLLILDLRCTVLIESIYMYPNLFQHVVYVKVKYVFHADFIKNVLYITTVCTSRLWSMFVIVFYADCEYTILYKIQNFFETWSNILWTNAVHLWSKSLRCQRIQWVFPFFILRQIRIRFEQYRENWSVTSQYGFLYWYVAQELVVLVVTAYGASMISVYYYIVMLA